MKLLSTISIFPIFYNYPLQALVIAIALLFLIYMVKRDLEVMSFNPTISPLEEVLEQPTITTSISCVEIDWECWSYRDIQELCRANGISGRNRKKEILVQTLMDFKY